MNKTSLSEPLLMLSSGAGFVSVDTGIFQGLPSGLELCCDGQESKNRSSMLTGRT